ncbi:MAG TPA: hypothetical protein VMU59_04275 [Caulobacteraceae bacterium]|nr:hypothetical protein [Caulobacteraceae bacterium]
MARRPQAAPPPPFAPPAFDAKRLIADIRKGDPDAIARAYRATFDNQVGRLVLAHHLADMGVGNVFGQGLTDAELRYAVGRHDAAIALAHAALFDQAAISVAVLSDNLEGSTDDETAQHQDADFGDGYTPLDDDY